MTTRIKIHDNTSTIRVNPVDNNDEVKVRQNNSAYLDSKINKEIQDRINADNQLQEEINQKQDTIKFININSERGFLDEESLNLLISSKVNKILYLNSNIYSLGSINNKYWRYIGETTDPNMIQTIVIDTETGEYVYSAIGNKVLQDHIADNERHVTQEEKNCWNNKLNFERNGETLQFNRN